MFFKTLFSSDDSKKSEDSNQKLADIQALAKPHQSYLGLLPRDLQGYLYNFVKAKNGLIIKVLFMGDADMKQTVFSSEPIKTIGIDYKTVQKNGYTIQFWDLAGQDRFKTITQAYHRGAHSIVLFPRNNEHLEQLATRLKESELGTKSIFVFTPEGQTFTTNKVNVQGYLELNKANATPDALATYIFNRLGSRVELQLNDKEIEQVIYHENPRP